MQPKQTDLLQLSQKNTFVGCKQLPHHKNNAHTLATLSNLIARIIARSDRPQLTAFHLAAVEDKLEAVFLER
jgi:hypothetical protein